MKRRAMLQRVGAVGAIGSLAGCIDRISGTSGTDPGGESDGGENGNDGTDAGAGGNGSEGNGTDENGIDEEADGADDSGDSDDMSIDGRLHNESDETRTFAIEIRNADDEVVAGDEWDVDARSAENVPAFGSPGEPRTFEVTVGEVRATETFAFDVENAPEKKDGYVDVTYTAGGDLEIGFTPVDEGGDETGNGNGDGSGDGTIVDAWIDTVGADCGSGNEATLDLEGDAVEIHGAIEAPTPCHEAVIADTGSGDGLTVTIATESASDACVTCIGEIRYEAVVEFDGEPPTPFVAEHEVGGEAVEVARVEVADERAETSVTDCS